MKRKILVAVTGTVATTLTHKILKSYVEQGFEAGLLYTEKASYFIDWVKVEKMEFDDKISIYGDKYEWPPTHKYFKNDIVGHIQLREEYSALVVICSANTLAKMANGICDNLLTSVIRAWPQYKPLVIAPAMNTTMWESYFTQEHIKKMKHYHEGFRVVNPQSKALACGTEGMGALADISEIVSVTAEQFTWRFPLNKCYAIPVNPHPGAFAFARKGSRHTGVDLYTDEGAGVFAVEDGEVVGIEHFTGEWDNSPWWNNTDCVLIKGRTGVVNYGEIVPAEGIKIGDKLHKGDLVGNVTRVIKEGRDHYEITGWRPTMLHMELYPYSVTKASHGFEEQILNDATPFLLESVKTFVNDGYVDVVTYDGYKP